jgi:hypothetical protein
MAAVSRNQQADIMRQQLSLARTPVGGGGGGGGGGGYYTLADLFPGYGQPPPGAADAAKRKAKNRSNIYGGGEYAKRQGRTR